MCVRVRACICVNVCSLVCTCVCVSVSVSVCMHAVNVCYSSCTRCDIGHVYLK